MNILCAINLSIFAPLRVLFLVCLLFCAFSIHAEEIILEITEEEQEQIVQKYKSELYEKIYFAKRYKIVKVNADPLIGLHENISMTLFADTELTMNSQELKPYSRGRRSSTWYGLLDSEDIQKYIDELDFPPPGLPKKVLISKEQFIRQLIGVNLTINVWDLNLDTNEYQLSSVNYSKEVNNNLKHDAMTSIRGRITVHELNKKFAISAIQSSPTYHLIVELDEKREFQNLTFYPGGVTDTEIAENDERRQKYLDAIKHQPDSELDKRSP